jgi:tetratricopeptide (TPR) repeat protein
MWSNVNNPFKTRYARTLLAALLGTALSLSAQASGRSEFNEGYTALMHHDYNRSIVHLTNAIESGNLRKADVAIAYHLRGADYLKTGREDEAIADFDHALALNPSLSTVYNDRAIAFRRKGDFTRAFADYSEAIKLMPNVDSFYLNRGLAYAKNRQWEEAIADYKQALYYKPDNVSALVALGDAHMQQGHKADAVAAYQSAMREQSDLLEMYPGVGKKLADLGVAPVANLARGGAKPTTTVTVLNPTRAGNMMVLSDTL